MAVWAVNHDKHDVSGAQQYGDVRRINTRYIYGDEIIQEELPAVERDRLYDAAHQFDFNDDYVLIVGDHLQLAVFMKALGEASVGRRIHMLRYDKKAEGYIAVWV